MSLLATIAAANVSDVAVREFKARFELPWDADWAHFRAILATVEQEVGEANHCWHISILDSQEKLEGDDLNEIAQSIGEFSNVKNLTIFSSFADPSLRVLVSGQSNDVIPFVVSVTGHLQARVLGLVEQLRGRLADQSFLAAYYHPRNAQLAGQSESGAGKASPSAHFPAGSVESPNDSLWSHMRSEVSISVVAIVMGAVAVAVLVAIWFFALT